MKKFGTPAFAAPGSASENDGSSCEGGSTWASGTGVEVGVGVGVATLPVSDCVFASPFALLDSSSSCLSSVTGSSWVACRALGLSGLALLGARAWRSRSGAGVGVAVAVGWTVGEAVAVGVGVLSVEPRSTIEAIGAGRPGICSWSSGVPGGMSTVIVSCWPVTSVTRT